MGNGKWQISWFPVIIVRNGWQSALPWQWIHVLYGLFRPLWLQDHFGVNLGTNLKMAHDAKMIGRGAKRSEIGTQG